MIARPGRGVRAGVALAVLALVAGLSWLANVERRAPSGPDLTSEPTRAPSSGDAEIAAAFRERRSGVWVEASGVVDRVLADDRQGSRHQRFVLRLANRHTVLVAHNIDLAPRAPLSAGDRVTVRGQYEWNDRGGVVHWTHHDPERSRPGGWIDLGGRRYR